MSETLFEVLDVLLFTEGVLDESAKFRVDSGAVRLLEVSLPLHVLENSIHLIVLDEVVVMLM